MKVFNTKTYTHVVVSTDHGDFMVHKGSKQVYRWSDFAYEYFYYDDDDTVVEAVLKAAEEAFKEG